jgi:uncharacterized protein YqeY
MKVFNSVQDILNEKNKYRENRVIYDMLCVLVGEIDRMPNRSKSTADEIYTCVNRMYNNAKEMSQYKEESKIELEYLQDYIKKQLTDAELVEIIMQYKEDGLKNIGDYMRALNSEYKGRFDGKKVSQLINQLK